MEKENQRVAVTKRMLKEGLLRLAAHKNLDQISVSELCAEAGINRTTFYRHYGCPQDVMREIESELIDGYRRTYALPKTPQESARRLEATISYLYEHADLVKILMRTNADTNLPTLLRETSRIAWDVKEDVRGLRHLDGDSLRLMTTFLVSGGYYMLRQWLLEEIPKSPQEVTSLLLAIVNTSNLVLRE